MALQVSNVEAIGILANLREQVMVEQAAYARKRSVPHADKVRRNEEVQRQKAAIDTAYAALKAASASEPA